jgi:membrane fusion protein, heavy metal efflux system
MHAAATRLPSEFASKQAVAGRRYGMSSHLMRPPTRSNPKPDFAGPRGGALLVRIGRALPTLLIVVALAGLAYWGHVTDWKMPRLSVLRGETPAKEPDWCPEHGVPESLCVECKPELLPRHKVAYCKVHGVAECPLDHPEIAQVKGQPQLPAYDVLAALHFLQRPENNSRCNSHERRIQFSTAAAADKAGIEIDLVQERPMAEYVEAHGDVAYDQTRVARLSARVPGTVWRVDKKVGDPVRAGEILALVDAAEVGRAKAEFLQAVAQQRLRTKNLETLRATAASGALPERTLREAETTLSESRIRVRGAQQGLVNLGLPVIGDWVALADDRLAAYVQFLGLPAAVAEQFDPTRTTANLLPLAAPLDGVVVAREAVAGEVVDPTRTLFVVADPSRMWLTLHVRLEDAQHLALGQPVHFRPDGSSAEVAGRVSWVSTAADEKTRTVKVRAELANPEGRLRANTFGQGRVVLRAEPRAIVVPREAVHSDGDVVAACQIVFVRDRHYLEEAAPKVYHVRKVRTGARDERYVEVLAGLLPGEVVATRGSAVLRAELLKGNLGEG